MQQEYNLNMEQGGKRNVSHTASRLFLLEHVGAEIFQSLDPFECQSVVAQRRGQESAGARRLWPTGNFRVCPPRYE